MVSWSLHQALERAGLPRIRVHDLRHTAATLLLSQGVHPKVVQELLGHSSITLTLDTYSHVLPGLHADAAARMDALFDGIDDSNRSEPSEYD
jgi:integrase